MSLTWRDNATNETGFVVERCTGAGCTNFAQIAAPGPKSGSGTNVTYVDTTVTGGNTYLYRVKAVNAIGSSAYAPVPPAIVSAVIPAIPVTPGNPTVASLVKNTANANYTVTLTWTAGANPNSFTIQRATNGGFTTGVVSFTIYGLCQEFLAEQPVT